MTSVPDSFQLNPSKAQRLEQRLLGQDGLSGAPLSRDGLSASQQGVFASSVVGFNQPAETTAGATAGSKPVGFDHIVGRADGQVAAVPNGVVAPPAAPVAGGSPSSRNGTGISTGALLAPPSGGSAFSSMATVSPAPSAPNSGADAGGAATVPRLNSFSPPANTMAASRVDSQSSTRQLPPGAIGTDSLTTAPTPTTAVAPAAQAQSSPIPVVLVPNAPPPRTPAQVHPGGLRRQADILREQMDAAAAAVASAAAVAAAPAIAAAAVSRFDMPLSLPAPPPAAATISSSPTKVIRPSKAQAGAAGSAGGGASNPAASSSAAGTKRKASSPSPRPRKPKAPVGAAGSGTGVARSKKPAIGGSSTPEQQQHGSAAVDPADANTPDRKRAKLPPHSLNATFSGTAQPTSHPQHSTPPPTPYASLTHPASPLRAGAAAAAMALSPLSHSAQGLAPPGISSHAPVPIAHTAAAVAPHSVERQISDVLGTKGKDIKSYFSGGGSSTATDAHHPRGMGSISHHPHPHASAAAAHASRATAMQIDSSSNEGDDAFMPHHATSAATGAVGHESAFGHSQSQSTIAAFSQSQSLAMSQSQSLAASSISQPVLSQQQSGASSHSTKDGGGSGGGSGGMDTDSDSEVMIMGETRPSSSHPSAGDQHFVSPSSTPTPTSTTASSAVKKETMAGGGGSAGAPAKKKVSRKKKESVSTSPLGAANPSIAAAAVAAANSSSSSSSSSCALTSSATGAASSNAVVAGGGASSESLAALAAQQARCREWESALLARERAVEERERELELKVASTSATAERVASLEASLAAANTDSEDYRRRIHAVMHELFIELCDARMARTEEKLIRDAVSIGRLVPNRDLSGHGVFGAAAQMHDQWEDGEVIKEIRARMMQLKKEKEEVEHTKKQLARRKASMNRAAKQENSNKEGAAGSAMLSSMDAAGSAAAASSFAAAASSSAAAASSFPVPDDGGGDDHATTTSDGFARPVKVDPYALREAEEVASMRLALLKSAIAEQEAKAEAWDTQRKTLVRVAKLHAEQRLSPYQNHPVLGKRYVMLNLLGKGGFSEVHQAFDLQELRYVACKVHQLNPAWTHERKANYTKRATREYNIHKTLQHPRIVALLDVFAINSDAFATVLEYADGQDLDMYLKIKHTLSEREARCIIGQVFAALRYINARNDTIIHYDLKPGNILFHKGEVKITDFGLSKVVLDAAASDAGGSGLGQIELTSQGAGTYWYLPPECLRASGPGGRPASISSAVDVYSAGVVLFQMLYGKKPFGQGLSPDDMSALSQRTGPDAHRVTFPEAPVVSQASKDFIQHCLMYDPLKRPNIKTLHTLPYFNPKAIPLGTTAK